jgi:hypothetical protein
MFALTRTVSLAEADPPESRNTDTEMTPSPFAAAHWVAEFLGSRTIVTETPPSAEGETRELGDPIPYAEMAPA